MEVAGRYEGSSGRSSSRHGHDKESRHSSRPKRDTSDNPPIHTVFLRDLASNVTNDEIQKLAAEFGPIHCMFSLANKRGIAFITFNDIRHAQNCVTGLENRLVHGRNVHCSFANAISDNSRQDPVPACSTINCRSERPTTSLTVEDVATAFGKFGEIRDYYQADQPNLFTLKYYDLRAARKAVAETGSVEISGERILVEFNLKDDGDHNFVHKREPRGQRSDRDDRFDRRSSSSDRRFNAYPPPPPPGYPQGYPPPSYQPPYPVQPPVYPYGGYPQPPSHPFVPPGATSSGQNPQFQQAQGQSPYQQPVIQPPYPAVPIPPYPYPQQPTSTQGDQPYPFSHLIPQPAGATASNSQFAQTQPPPPPPPPIYQAGMPSMQTPVRNEPQSTDALRHLQKLFGQNP